MFQVCSVLFLPTHVEAIRFSPRVPAGRQPAAACHDVKTRDGSVRQTETTALVGVLAKEVGPGLRVCPSHLVYPVHFL